MIRSMLLIFTPVPNSVPNQPIAPVPSLTQEKMSSHQAAQTQSHVVQNQVQTPVPLMSSPVSSTSAGLSNALGGLNLVSSLPATSQMDHKAEMSNAFEIVGATEVPVLTTNTLSNLSNLQIVDATQFNILHQVSSVPFRLMTNSSDTPVYLVSLPLESDSNINEINKENVNVNAETAGFIHMVNGLTPQGNKHDAETTPQQNDTTAQPKASDYDIDNIGEPHRTSTPEDQFEKGGRNAMNETIVVGNIEVSHMKKQATLSVLQEENAGEEVVRGSSTGKNHDSTSKELEVSVNKVVLKEETSENDIKIPGKKKVSRQLFQQNVNPKMVTTNEAENQKVHNKTYCQDWIQNHGKSEGTINGNTSDTCKDISKGPMVSEQSDSESMELTPLNSEDSESLDLTSISRKQPAKVKKTIHFGHGNIG